MIKLAVTIDGKKKDYISNIITTRMSIDAYRLLDREETARGSYDEALIQDILAFIVRLFNDQFTADDLLDGCHCSFFVMAPAMLRMIVASVNERLRDFEAENPPTAATATG